MASVTVLIKGTAEQRARDAGDRHLRMFTRDAGLFRFPLVPSSFSRTDIADVYETVDRPGRKPLIIRTGKNLEKLMFAAELWDHDRPILWMQKVLRRLKSSEDPVVVTFADNTMGTFLITGLAFTTTRENRNGNPTKSTADIELTEDSDAAAVVGPIPRGIAKNVARRA